MTDDIMRVLQEAETKRVEKKPKRQQRIKTKVHRRKKTIPQEFIDGKRELDTIYWGEYDAVEGEVSDMIDQGSGWMTQKIKTWRKKKLNELKRYYLSRIRELQKTHNVKGRYSVPKDEEPGQEYKRK